MVEKYHETQTAKFHELPGSLYLKLSLFLRNGNKNRIEESLVPRKYIENTFAKLM